MLSCSGLVSRACPLRSRGARALAGCYSGPSAPSPDDQTPPTRPPVSQARWAAPQLSPRSSSTRSRPTLRPAASSSTSTLTGAGFTRSSVVVVAGQESADHLRLAAASCTRTAARASAATTRCWSAATTKKKESRPLTLAVERSAPRILVPAEVGVDEDTEVGLVVDVVDVADPARALRVHRLGLPPGATWDEPTRTFSFTPDFTQGGDRWTVTVLAHDARVARREPPSTSSSATPSSPPRARRSSTSEFLDAAEDMSVTSLSQKTDEYLDSPGYAGREFVQLVMVPLEVPLEGAPVRIGLHGSPPRNLGGTGSANEIRISPHDPDNTYTGGLRRSGCHRQSIPPRPAAPRPTTPPRRACSTSSEYVPRHHPPPEGWQPLARLHLRQLDGAAAFGAMLVLSASCAARHFAYIDGRASARAAIACAIYPPFLSRDLHQLLRLGWARPGSRPALGAWRRAYQHLLGSRASTWIRTRALAESVRP